MNKILLTVLLTSFFALNIFAQKEKDHNVDEFCGSWVLDEDRSFVDQEIKDNFEDYKLAIARNESELKLSQSYSFKGQTYDRAVNLWTDKKGEDNNYTILNIIELDNSRLFYKLEDVKLKSKSQFKNGKIMRQGSYKRDFDQYPYIVEEIYSLSDDGKVLTILTQIRALTTESTGGILDRAEKLQRPRTRNYKEVFQRQ
ncbi:MAG TPA: hypothetical protein VIL74_11330 [Pyrinomonadaceae bacterium]|jgi:hypothetical protein